MLQKKKNAGLAKVEEDDVGLSTGTLRLKRSSHKVK